MHWIDLDLLNGLAALWRWRRGIDLVIYLENSIAAL